MGYEIDFSDTAKEHLKALKKTGDRSIMKKIFKLIEDIEKHPFEGIGKPEALKYDLSGFWSRRINREHRLVYKVTDTGVIKIYSLKGHY
jgi:toxin YoeB